MDSYAHQEPDIVYPEKQFESVIASLIQTTIQNENQSVIVSRFGLDLAVFIRRPTASRAVFIEAKSYSGQRQGGVGFGNGRGEGPQIDLLLLSNVQLELLDNHVRWAFADATLTLGTARYALLTCSEARNAAMGGVSRVKQNNFRISTIKTHLVTWSVFCENLSAFLFRS